MSKGIKKFRKNDYNDEQEFVVERLSVNKTKEKRIERALRTKDITALVEDDYDDADDYQFHWNQDTD